MKHTGGQILVKALEAQGVSRVFCVPGESFLAVLDALHDSPISVTVARQEGGAAMMAEATGKLTGRPGICFVTRGPGATNAASGVHVAQQDATPLILFIGQVERGVRGRDAFQEVDYRQMYGGMAKWAAEIETAARIPEMISRAFHVAMSGRPGPVVLSLPEDMLTEMAEAAPVSRVYAVEPAPRGVDAEKAAAILNSASKPIVIAGGSRWTAGAVEALHRFAERWQLPVAVTFRRQELFDHAHPNFAGDIGRGSDPKLLQYVRDADAVLLLGERFSEIPSQGYGLLQVPVPKQTLIHVFPDASELGRVYAPTLAIEATPGAFLDAMSGIEAASAARNALVEDLHTAATKWAVPKPNGLALDMAAVVQAVQGAVPQDAIICNGAGNYAVWVHRFYRYRGFGTQLAPVSGSMGYGLPAAIAAKLAHPDRTVVCFAGDGCLQMTMQELGTAAEYGLPIVVIVADNGMYGTIRMHQEREYPGRVIASGLRNPDFAAIARAYGAHAETVAANEEFGPAFQRCLDANRLALIHLKLDPDAITPTQTLASLARG
jgi:acetolactate synthase-1/2/3 large subunit